MTEQTSPRTWTFDGEEGGVIEFTYDAEHHTTRRYSGPDCDGWSTVTNLEFLPLVEHREAGVWYRNHTAKERTWTVYAADPREAAREAAQDELGHLTISHYLRHQPDHQD